MGHEAGDQLLAIIAQRLRSCVKEGDTVALKPVTVVQQDETQAVIGEGVAAGERVVTSGFSRLTAGSKVQVSAPS